MAHQVMKRETQIKLKQSLVIIIAWVIMGFIITVYDFLVLISNHSLGPDEEYRFTISMIRNMGAGLIGALLGGSLLVFYVNVKYRDKPYGYTILATFVSFILIVALITLIMAATLVPLETGRPLSDPVSQQAFRAFVEDSYPIKNGLVWSIIVATTQLLLQVSNKFGHSNFWNIIRGKYNTPKEEQRIFMFLDINSSTAIAEKLGDETYHTLLQDFFADITGPIVNNKGNIYQYVGDEVVIAWNYQDGIPNAECLQCFFDLKLSILQKKHVYINRYGLVPSFKAGVHCGKVVAGEVGIIKRDITYSGDVLNTTSRILNLCKDFQVELLASSDLLGKLSLNDKFEAQPLGSIQLKGKARKIFLNALTPA